MKALPVRADVSSERDVIDLFAASDGLGVLGALINIAGMVAARARVDQMEASRIVQMMNANVVGCFLCAREAVRRMSTRYGGAGGVIVNVSSAAARLGSPGEYVDYAASKGAIDTMTIGLAQEVAAESVRVNAVRPGLIATQIHASGGQPDRLEGLRSSIPIGRRSRPERLTSWSRPGDRGTAQVGRRAAAPHWPSSTEIPPPWLLGRARAHPHRRSRV